jgi:type VI secretion system protein ImpJ
LARGAEDRPAPEVAWYRAVLPANKLKLQINLQPKGIQLIPHQVSMKLASTTIRFMSWYNKVAWSEGLFLRPQLFQQQERYLEHLAHKRTASLGPFYWGFTHYSIDAESLSLGKLVLGSAAGIFSDGTPFDAPGQTLPPAPLTILPEHLEQVIYLAVPIRTPNGEETTFDDATAASLARFSVFDTELRDANSIGPRTEDGAAFQAALAAAAAAGAHRRVDRPSARQGHVLRSDGSIAIDPHLIPPVAGYGASPAADRLDHQPAWLVPAARAVAGGRLSGNDGKSSEAAEVSDFLLLQILNRYEALFEHWLRVRETSPEASTRRCGPSARSSRPSCARARAGPRRTRPTSTWTRICLSGN